MEPGAGMHPFIQIGLLGIDMPVEMDDADLAIAEMPADPSHRWEADRMVAAQDDREGAAGKHVGHPFGDLIETLLVVGGNREDVSDIAQANLLAEIDAHLVVVRGVQRRDAADALRTEPRARSIGGAAVVGNAQHGNVIVADLIHILQVGSLHEGVDAGVVRQFTAREGGNPPVHDACRSIEPEVAGPVHLRLPTGQRQLTFLFKGLHPLAGMLTLKTSRVV